MRKSRQQPAHIPQLAEELTPEWFTAILPNRGAVVDVQCATIGTDIGFMGVVYRCGLTWDDDGSTADRPSSVIIKVPTQNAENFQLGDMMKVFEREIVVYRSLRSSLGVRMPEYFHGEMDPDPAPWLDRPMTFLLRRLPVKMINWLIGKLLKPGSTKKRRRFILVLEDVTNARPPTQIEGGSLDDALRALRTLGRFHAANWMRTDALESYSRIWPLNNATRVVQANYLRNRENFVERFGATVGGDVMVRLDDIQQRVPEIENALAAEPWTLLHGDYRLDNLLFLPDGEIVVLDFQGLSYGRPAFDVAYFITTALTGAHRGEKENLLRTYHDALVAGGVTAYSWDQLNRDSQLATESLAHRIVGAADILDTQLVGGGDPLIDVMQLRVLDWLD